MDFQSLPYLRTICPGHHPAALHGPMYLKRIWDGLKKWVKFLKLHLWEEEASWFVRMGWEKHRDRKASWSKWSIWKGGLGFLLQEVLTLRVQNFKLIWWDRRESLNDYTVSSRRRERRWREGLETVTEVEERSIIEISRWDGNGRD